MATKEPYINNFCYFSHNYVYIQKFDKYTLFGYQLTKFYLLAILYFYNIITENVCKNKKYSQESFAEVKCYD